MRKYYLYYFLTLLLKQRLLINIKKFDAMKTKELLTLLILSLSLVFISCENDISGSVIDNISDDTEDVEEPAGEEEPEIDPLLVGEWVLDPTQGSLAVGPSANDLSWWSISSIGVVERSCFYDDLYIFGEDGTFEIEMGDATWLEAWQEGIEEDEDGCGAPIAPHDGTNAGTWSADGENVTISGEGLFLGLAKVHNGGEDGNPGNDTIEYEYTLVDNDQILEVRISGWLDDVPEATWFFRFTNQINDNTTDGSDSDSPEDWVLVWSDEFEADQLDSDRWSFQLGTGSQFGLVGWGNNELQYYTEREENVFIEDGFLNIVALEESFGGMNYTSGRIRTIDKADWKFGKFEIMAKLPEGQGMWPAIWMLPTEEVFGGWPKSGEIDIMELVGHLPSTVHGTVHFGKDWPDNKQNTSTYSLQDGKFSDDFHLFSIEWEEDEIRWYVDGQLYHIIKPGDLEPENYPFNEEFHLLLNLAVGGDWPGNPDSSTLFPQSLVIDYIRVFEKEE